MGHIAGVGLRRVGNDGTERAQGAIEGVRRGHADRRQIGSPKDLGRFQGGAQEQRASSRSPNNMDQVTQLSVATGAVRQCFDTEQRARIRSVP